MIVEVDRSSDEPPHAQLTRQIVRLIADRSLAVGTRLPTVRQLATDLGIAPNTVVRCYRDLETSGLVQTDGRRGTTVSGSPAIAQQQRLTALVSAAHTFAELVRASGATHAEARAALNTALTIVDR